MDITLLAPQLQKIQSLSQFISDCAIIIIPYAHSPEIMKAATSGLDCALCKLADAINEMNANVNELDQ